MLVLMLACAGPQGDTPVPADKTPTDGGTTTETGQLVDLRMAFPDEPEGGYQIVLNDVTIPPYTETFICLYGTWTGPDVGVVYVSPHQPKPFGHHAQLKAVPIGYEEPDGMQRVCPGADTMNLFTPFFEAVVNAEDGQENIDYTNMMILPEGVAVKLKSGQHWTFDTHWVNTSGNYINVNAALNLGFIPAEEVEQWASSFQLDVGTLDIPAGEALSIPFDCSFPEDLTVLSILGHMHGYGTHYSVDHLKEDGSIESVYDLVWDPKYRDEGQVLTFGEGDLVVKNTEALRTTCSWNNTTDESLGFPDEMCTTVGVGYPLEEPFACFRDF